MLNLSRLIICLLLLTAGAVSHPAQAKTASGGYQKNFTVSEQLTRDNRLFLLEKIASNMTSVSGKLFTGEQYDQGLDQYYLRARYYDPAVGRFTQMDSWMGNNQDPISLHKYLYANVDPVNNIDPSGNFGLFEAGVVNNIIGIQNSMSIDAGFSVLDSGLGMLGDENAQDTVRSAQTFIAIASLGAGGIALTKILAKKFFALSKAARFDKFRKGIFGDIQGVRPRSLDRVGAPAGGVTTLTHDNISSLANKKVYVFIVDESDNLLLALRGSAGRSGVKHTQLNGGGPAKAAGELMVSGGKVLINNQSGRYSAQAAGAVGRVKALLQSLDLPVEITGPL